MRSSATSPPWMPGVSSSADARRWTSGWMRPGSGPHCGPSPTTPTSSHRGFSGIRAPSRRLAAQAARRMGLHTAAVDLVEHAGLVCRLGAIGVSAATWARPGPLSGIERERVRTVPYLTERVLAHQPRLAEIGAIASMVHERADGSGYPRGLSGNAIPPAARLLAAAQVYQALREERPHRSALEPAAAQAVLLEEARQGRLDTAAVNAVLAAAGHQVRRRPNLIAGLSTARGRGALPAGSRAVRTSRLPRSYPSPRAPSEVTSSTSTRRSESARAALRRCTRCATAWSTRASPARRSRKDRVNDRCHAEARCHRTMA